MLEEGDTRLGRREGDDGYRFVRPILQTDTQRTDSIVGKAIFWLVIIFAVLFCLRMYNVSQQKRRERRAAPPPSSAGEPMVRCTRCGIFLPRSEAQLVEGKIRCRDKECA